MYIRHTPCAVWIGYVKQEKTRRRPHVNLMLVHRLRCWPTIKPTLDIVHRGTFNPYPARKEPTDGSPTQGLRFSDQSKKQISQS